MRRIKEVISGITLILLIFVFPIYTSVMLWKIYEKVNVPITVEVRDFSEGEKGNAENLVRDFRAITD